MEYQDIVDACQLIGHAIKNSATGKIIGRDISRYSRDSEFANIVDACCEGLGLCRPIKYEDNLYVSPIDKNSPFALNIGLFSQVRVEKRPIVLAMMLVAIKCFWTAGALYGDYTASKWINEKEIGEKVREMANEINASEQSKAVTALWQKIFRLRDNIECKNSNSEDLLGYAKTALNRMVDVNFAIKRETDDGMRFNATPLLCACLLTKGWENFERKFSFFETTDEVEE